MILRYDYFKHTSIIDQEAVLSSVPTTELVRLSFDNLEQYLGVFTPTIIKYKGNRENLPLIKSPKNNKFNVNFFFTQEEMNEIEKDNPNFAQYLLKGIDRLALDKDGNLYDIDDQEEKSFVWFIFALYAE